MRVIMLAPPGAGKGTQGERIAARYGVPHISSGEIFRDEVTRQTPLAVLSARPGPARLSASSIERRDCSSSPETSVGESVGERVG